MKTKKHRRGNRCATVDPDPQAEQPAPDAGDSPDEQQAARSKAMAKNLREVASGSYLYASCCHFFGGSVPADTYVRYMEELLQDCGATSDPLESMLVEQLVITHHAVGRLLGKSGLSDHCDEATNYAVAAARLAAEFRRSTLALRQYRVRASERLRVVADDDDATKECVAREARA